jgi:hypothetical protein
MSIVQFVAADHALAILSGPSGFASARGSMVEEFQVAEATPLDPTPA